MFVLMFRVMLRKSLFEGERLVLGCLVRNLGTRTAAKHHLLAAKLYKASSSKMRLSVNCEGKGDHMIGR